MLELTRIELENFRPFYDKNDIEIGYSKNKLVIFEGNTGEGKTSLAEAIKWCLFGLHLSDDEPERADFDLFNKDVLVKSKINEPITCRVTLTFESIDKNNSKEKIVFSRSIQIRRKKDLHRTQTGVVQVRIEEFEFIKDIYEKYHKFTVVKWVDSRQVPLETAPQTIRATYFPGIVNDYYIVFGEKFVDPNNPDKIRMAIERNCFAGYFDLIKENLENVKIDMIKEYAGDSRKKEKLDDLIRLRDDNLNSLKEKKGNLQIKRENLIKINDAISKLDKKIGESGSEQARLLRDERKTLEDEIKQLHKEIKENEKEITGNGYITFIQILSQNAEKELINDIEKRIKKGEIPPNIKTEFINSLIEDGKCICKREITAKEKKILEELRDEYVIGENYNEFLNLKFRLKDNIENLPQKVNDHLQKLEHVENLKLQSRSHEDRLKGISEELDSLKDVDKLEKDRIRLKTIHDNIEADIEILKNEIDYLEEDIKSILRDIKKVGEIDLKDEEYSKKTKFISEIINQIENVKINIIDSTRKDIEKFSSEIYKKLYRHAAEVDRLELDTNYQTRVVIKKDGKEYVKTNFSTGEGLVFAISFLTGLRKYSGYNGPIFLDSPYSVLDEEHRTRVSLNLPQTVPGQLIVFTRPDTFEDIKNDMMPHINKLIKLVKEKEWHVKIIK